MSEINIKHLRNGSHQVQIAMTGVEIGEKARQVLELLGTITANPIEGFAVIHFVHGMLKKQLDIRSEPILSESPIQ